ncbi:MAG: hypothetical protein WBL93_09690 [Lutisporaceae bacterium]
MIKYIFLMIAMFTLFLNILLTYYLIRNKTTRCNSYTRNREVVSFDLSYNELNREEAEATTVLDTEVITESNKELQGI